MGRRIYHDTPTDPGKPRLCEGCGFERTYFAFTNDLAHRGDRAYGSSWSICSECRSLRGARPELELPTLTLHRIYDGPFRLAAVREDVARKLGRRVVDNSKGRNVGVDEAPVWTPEERVALLRTIETWIDGPEVERPRMPSWLFDLFAQQIEQAHRYPDRADEFLSDEWLTAACDWLGLDEPTVRLWLEHNANRRAAA
jgi:hypothetical protein